jgi:SAM-dependent methyltransferase
MMGSYDQIGQGYTVTRRPDPRIASQIVAALGDARSVVNVGAGSGSYEPDQIAVVAVEPSIEMIRQRPSGAAPVAQARAEALPFPDCSFDAALAILTIHHWSDLPRGLAELRRVARRRVVILTCDPDRHEKFWLVTDYLPEIAELDRARLQTMRELARLLGKMQTIPVMIPADCHDGFQGAFWARPEAYLDPNVRRGISTFALLPDEKVRRGLDRLAGDLRSGHWDERFGHLRRAESIDLGYRLIVLESRD